MALSPEVSIGYSIISMRMEPIKAFHFSHTIGFCRYRKAMVNLCQETVFRSVPRTAPCRLPPWQPPLRLQIPIHMHEMHHQEHSSNRRQQHIPPPQPDRHIIQRRHHHNEQHHDEHALMPAEIQSPAQEIQQKNAHRYREEQPLPSLGNREQHRLLMHNKNHQGDAQRPEHLLAHIQRRRRLHHVHDRIRLQMEKRHHHIRNLLNRKQDKPQHPEAKILMIKQLKPAYHIVNPYFLCRAKQSVLYFSVPGSDPSAIPPSVQIEPTTVFPAVGSIILYL